MTSFVVGDLSEPTRIDRVIRQKFPEWGRKAVQGLVNAGQVRVNGRKVWLCSWTVRNGDRLEILRVPPEKKPPPDKFDDAWLIEVHGDLFVINKPAGLLSEPTKWSADSSLLTLATARFGSVTLRHRLDRDTSGVLLLTRKNPDARSLNRYLDEAFKSGTIKKWYVAIVAASHTLPMSGIVRTRLDTDPHKRDRMVVVNKGGKLAITRYQIERKVDERCLVNLWPETGRTHQLRVHMQHLGTPILGDRLYGRAAMRRRANGERLMLHAHQITLPASGNFGEKTLIAPLPEEFTNV